MCNRPGTLFALCLSIAAFGCDRTAPEDIATTPERPAVPFEGKADPALAGAWKTADGKSTYTLMKDGGYTFVGRVSSPGGTFDNKFSGKWLINKGQMLFQDGKGMVVPYDCNVQGDKMTLTLTGSMKRQTILRRVAAG